MVDTPTEEELQNVPFAKYNFHRGGQGGVDGLGDIAYICATKGNRTVAVVKGPQPNGTVDWTLAKESDFLPDEHCIVVYDIHVPPGMMCAILLQQNKWHGVAPWGVSTGQYAGFQTPKAYAEIAKKFADMQRKGTYKAQHIEPLRKRASDGLMFTWEQVVVICIIMGAPFPLYGSGKANVQDGADKSGRDLPTLMALFNTEERLDSDGNTIPDAAGLPKRKLRQPSFRPDGTIVHTDVEYRRQVEERGIRIHDDFWAKDFPLWVNCPLWMYDTYGEEYLMRIGLIPMR